MVTIPGGTRVKPADPRINIRYLFQKKTEAGSFRAYQTLRTNGQYPSLVGPEEWARESCPHERIGRFHEFEVILHSDINIPQCLFGPTLVLQAEFVPEANLQPHFYLRSDALIDPGSGILRRVNSEDYRKYHRAKVNFCRNVDEYYHSGFFDELFPQLKMMFGVFRQVAREEKEYAKFWGFGGRYEAYEPDLGLNWTVAAPDRQIARIPSDPSELIVRVRRIGDQKVTLEMAEAVFGVSVVEGKGSKEIANIYRKAIRLIHPDRNNNPEIELLARLLNQAMDFFK
jgi:hypothetical protein